MRPTISTCPLHIECLNLFGSEGGYDKILDFLKDANSIDSDLLKDLIILSGNAFLMYHRDFVRKFALDIKNSVKKLIFKMTNIDPKYIASKFKSIIKPLANLLKRVNPIEEVKDEIETLQLKFIIYLVHSGLCNIFICVDIYIIKGFYKLIITSNCAKLFKNIPPQAFGYLMPSHNFLSSFLTLELYCK